MSGQEFVKTHAVRHLVTLLSKLSSEGNDKALLDDLDALRRFERVFPKLGTELNDLLEQPLPHSAERLLRLAERELKDRLPMYPAKAVEVVARALQPSATP